jgi:hypothetical protein
MVLQVYITRGGRVKVFDELAKSSKTLQELTKRGK